MNCITVVYYYFKSFVVGKNVSRRFTEECLIIQKDFATIVSHEFLVDDYIYDLNGIFDNAPKCGIKGVSYQMINGKYVVLSKTAQRIFKDSNEYFQFIVDLRDVKLQKDGVLLDFQQSLLIKMGQLQIKDLNERMKYIKSLVDRYSLATAAEKDKDDVIVAGASSATVTHAMGQNRLSALSLLSIDKDELIILKNDQHFYENVINKFCNKNRRIDLLYK